MKTFKQIRESSVFSGDDVDAKIGNTPIKTGHPIEFHYIRNTEKAPNFGAKFGQDIEPHGQYITPVDSEKEAHEAVNRLPNYEHGKVKFNNPLVLKQDDDLPTVGWKQRLSSAYNNKKGKALSRAIAKSGHDGIITAHPRYGVSETVNLKMFHNYNEEK